MNFIAKFIAGAAVSYALFSVFADRDAVAKAYAEEVVPILHPNGILEYRFNAARCYKAADGSSGLSCIRW